MKQLIGLFTAFFKIGLFTIGGGLAMLPLIQRTVVKDKGWMEEEEMLDCIAVSQALPGVMAINVATYVGSKQRGFPGAVFATLGIVSPSYIIIILAIFLLGALGENPYVEGAFSAVKAASCALILYSAYKMARKSLKGKFQWAIALVSFVLISFVGMTALWAIVGGALIGLVIWQVRKVRQ